MKDNLEEISGSIMDVTFSSHEEMSEMAKLWDVEQIQIEKGPFNGSLYGINTPHIQIAKAIRSHGVIIKGKSPSNSYMFAYVNGIGKVTHNGLPFTSNELLILDDNDEIDFMSTGPSYDITIAIDKAFFEKTYKGLFDLPFIYDREKNIIELTSTKEHSIGYDLDRWSDYLSQTLDEWVNDSILIAEIEKNIIETLCSHLGGAKEYKLLSSQEDAIALYRYIDKNYREDITITEIYDTLKTSERAVRSSFKKIFGLSPKEYLSRYRLGKFRNSLIKNLDDNPSISIIGFQEGLFNSNRFPNEYNQMFGHLPSYELSKKKTDS